MAAHAAELTDKAYVLKIDRPSHVGDLADIHVQLRTQQTTTTRVPGAKPSSQVQESAVDLEARMEVRGVAPDGAAVIMLLTVSKMTDAAGAAILAPGTVVEITRGEQEITAKRVPSGSLSEKALHALQMLYSSHPSAAPSDDEMFRTLQPHKIGETWDIDSDKSAAAMKLQGLDVQARDVAGKATLLGLEEVRGMATLRFAMQTKVTNGRLPPPANGWTETVTALRGELGGVFPVDVTQQPLQLSKHTVSEVHLTSTDGTTMDVTDELLKTSTMTPVQAGG